MSAPLYALDVTALSFCVAVPEAAFLALDGLDGGDGAPGETLTAELTRLGAYKIEFNGHYGSNVFFTLAADDDTPKLRAEIASAIRAICARV